MHILQVTLNNEFSVRWTVPTATEDDNVGKNISVVYA